MPPRLARRRGSSRLDPCVRKRISRFARRNNLNPPLSSATAAVECEPTLLPHSCVAGVFADFIHWYFSISAPAEQRVVYSPQTHTALCIAATAGEPWRLLFLVSAFWRIDNSAVWGRLAPLLAGMRPNWQRVKRVLMETQHSDGVFGSSRHCTYVSPAWKGVSLAEQHVVILRRWFNCLRRANVQFVVAAPAAGAVLRRRIVVRTSTDLASLLARLPACGVYTAKNIVASLVLHGAVEAGSDIVGPGAQYGARALLGVSMYPRAKGLWPWEKDPRGERSVVQGLAQYLGISFADAQQCLCWWHKWRQVGDHAACVQPP